MAKRGLGRGIDALLGAQDATEDEVASVVEKAGGTVHVPIDALSPNPHQPRKHFPEAALAELTESIRDRGIIQPLIAEDAGDGRYTIVAGERRFRAAQAAGLREVPVILRSFSEGEKREIALIENVQREDLSPIEEADAYRSIMESSGIGQEELAKRVGKNRSTIANSLRLLNLSREARQAVDDGELSPGHARALLSLRDPETQSVLLHEMLTAGLSVREAERRAKELGASPLTGEIGVTAQSGGRSGSPTDDDARGDRTASGSHAASAPTKSPELRELERRLIDKLGSKVSIVGSNNRGRIEIAYHSTEDLEDVYRRLAGEPAPDR